MYVCSFQDINVILLFEEKIHFNTTFLRAVSDIAVNFPFFQSKNAAYFGEAKLRNRGLPTQKVGHIINIFTFNF